MFLVLPNKGNPSAKRYLSSFPHFGIVYCIGGIAVEPHFRLPGVIHLEFFFLVDDVSTVCCLHSRNTPPVVH